MSASRGLGVAGFRQVDGRHDLAGLAVAALGNVFLNPGLLHRDAAAPPDASPSMVVTRLPASSRQRHQAA